MKPCLEVSKGRDSEKAKAKRHSLFSTIYKEENRKISENPGSEGVAKHTESEEIDFPRQPPK